jgi:hypothetical protein
VGRPIDSVSRIRIVLLTLLAGLIWIQSTSPSQAKPLTTGALNGPAHVKVFQGSSSFTEIASFQAYDPSYQGGVTVAAGDVNGDGAPDIITGTASLATHVKAFDGRSGAQLQSFLAYDGFSGGVFVASGDLDGDGAAEIITGAGAGAGPHVKVFDGTTGLESASFFAFTPGVIAGVRVAAGDVNGDGFDDLIASLGEGASSHVKVFDGTNLASELLSFLAYGAFTGGVYVAAGDVNGDGFSDIITGAGAGGGPHVKVFSGANGAELQSFFAFDGVVAEARVAGGDVDGDGLDDIIVGLGETTGDTPVRVFNLKDSFPQVMATFTPYAGYARGVYVAGVTVPEPASYSLALVVAVLGMTVAPRWSRR